MLCIYVDDGIVAGPSESQVKKLLSALQGTFEITFNPLNFFLGLQVKVTTDKGISVNQTKYTEEILQRFQMADCKPAPTPMEADSDPPEQDQIRTDLPFREIVGALMYLAICTRYDIAFSVGYLSRFLDKPTTGLWKKAMRILRYLRGTTDFSLEYAAQNRGELICFSDADYAGDTSTRRSTTGQLLKFNGGVVSWASSRQHSVALSTTEAEFIAAAETAKSALWTARLLGELGYRVIPKLKIDNQSAIKLIQDPQYHKRTKHIDVRYHFIREKHERGDIQVEYVPTDHQEADLLTKPLNKTTFANIKSLVRCT